MSYPPPFAQILHGSLLVTAASPQAPLDLDYRGIAIAAHGRVRVEPRQDGFAQVPLAGHVTLGGGDIGAEAPLSHVTVVASAAGRAVLRGSLGKRRSRDALAPSPESIVTYYFNVDLAETLDLPATPAIYFVYAFLGPHVSNVVRIEVVNPVAAP